MTGTRGNGSAGRTTAPALSRLLGRDYWLIWSVPAAGTDRADDQGTAGAIAAADPFVRAGLRTFAVHRWRLNEGRVDVTVSLGTGAYDWR